MNGNEGVLFDVSMLLFVIGQIVFNISTMRRQSAAEERCRRHGR